MVLAATLLLGGCGGFSFSDLNPFREKETILPGTREPVITATDPLVAEGGEQAVALPAAVENGAWAQPGGVPSNAPGHLALSASPNRVWRSSAVGGSGDTRLAITPIAYQGRIYVVDTEGDLYAFSSGEGRRIWRVSVRPKHEDDDGVVGGGVAADAGQVYLASPYGIVAAFNASSGNEIWRAELKVPIRSAPTVADGRIYFVTAENKLLALSTADGSTVWEYRGIAEATGLLADSSPAYAAETLVVPYNSGEIIAFNAAAGEPKWVDVLSRSQRFSSVSGINEVAGRPAIDRGVVFAVSLAGRLVAVKLDSGERLWSRNIASTNTPIVAGETVFVNSTDSRLVAFSRGEGKVQWVTQLQAEDDDDPVIWSGPVLAGGRLWLVSSHEQLISVDAATGQITGRRDIGEAAYIAPIVVNRKLIVLTNKGDLLAYQ